MICSQLTDPGDCWRIRNNYNNRICIGMCFAMEMSGNRGGIDRLVVLIVVHQ
jgi:hypothetical protein